jgi:hypothetical protein
MPFSSVEVFMHDQVAMYVVIYAVPEREIGGIRDERHPGVSRQASGAIQAGTTTSDSKNAESCKAPD